MSTPAVKARHSSQAGMTLIEVLMALFVAAVALGAGFKAAGALWQQTERSELQWLAQLCADNQLTAYRLATRAPNAGTSQSMCEQMGRSFAVDVNVMGTPNPSFRRIEVVVSLPDGGQRLLQQTTLVARF
jgi:general secretion pathway protein I